MATSSRNGRRHHRGIHWRLRRNPQLFGRKWRAELGDSFKPVVSMRTINRMMANPPTGVTREPHRQQMLALIDKRMKTLDSLRKSVADQPAYPEALE